MISFDIMLKTLINDPQYFSKMAQEPAIFQNKNIFPDFPKSGPLAKYRATASFDWRKLKLAIEDEDALRLREKIWSFFEKHPLFQKKIDQTLPMDEQRHIATKRMMIAYNEKFYDVDEVS